MLGKIIVAVGIAGLAVAWFLLQPSDWDRSVERVVAANEACYERFHAKDKAAELDYCLDQAETLYKGRP